MMQRLALSLRACLGLALLAGIWAPAHALEADTVQEHVLANGMKVLLWPDESIPNLAIYTFWKVGSRNEAPGITGLAHFFEHMMFNGSRNYGPGEFDRTMEAAGGANNAYTSTDVTVYQDWVPASALSTTLDLEADRIGALSVDPEVVESERGVVMSERRRSIEDDNHRLMFVQLYSAAFMAHPYSWPIIGWRSDIENWRQQDVEQFHADWYTPNNAVMVIAGSFDPQKVLPELQQKLGTIPSRELARDVVTREPQQRGERRVELRKEASLPSVLMAWHVPETAHEDFRALEILSLLLSEGESSRLYRRLVDQEELALWLWTDTNHSFDPSLFELLVQNRDGVTSAAVEAAVAEEIARLVEKGIQPDELQKAKNMLFTQLYRNLETLSGKAQSLGTYELFFGGWRNLHGAEEAYQAVTAQDVQRVARDYLVATNRTVVSLIPTGSEEEEGADAR